MFPLTFIRSAFNQQRRRFPRKCLIYFGRKSNGGSIGPENEKEQRQIGRQTNEERWFGFRQKIREEENRESESRQLHAKEKKPLRQRWSINIKWWLSWWRKWVRKAFVRFLLRSWGHIMFIYVKLSSRGNAGSILGMTCVRPSGFGWRVDSSGARE